MVDDYEVAISHIKGSAKRLYNSASQVANCRPMNGKILNMNRENTRQNYVEPELHFYETFSLGMYVPNGKLDLIDGNIMISKKVLFGQVLQENEEIQRLEAELMAADTQNRSSRSLKINVRPIDSSDA